MKITEYKDEAFKRTLGRHYKDFDIEGCSDIRRAKVPHKIKKGDIFNIYRGESTKEGCIWQGDLKSSLMNHLREENIHTTSKQKEKNDTD